MNDPHNDILSWDGLTWQDIQAIGRTLAATHTNENTLSLAPERVTELVAHLPGFHSEGGGPDEFTLSAIITAWIAASEGDDDSSPYEHLA
jgi:FeS assembly protein IscX